MMNEPLSTLGPKAMEPDPDDEDTEQVAIGLRDIKVTLPRNDSVELIIERENGADLSLHVGRKRASKLLAYLEDSDIEPDKHAVHR